MPQSAMLSNDPLAQGTILILSATALMVAVTVIRQDWFTVRVLWRWLRRSVAVEPPTAPPTDFPIVISDDDDRRILAAMHETSTLQDRRAAEGLIAPAVSPAVVAAEVVALRLVKGGAR